MTEEPRAAQMMKPDALSFGVHGPVYPRISGVYKLTLKCGDLRSCDKRSTVVPSYQLGLLVCVKVEANRLTFELLWNNTGVVLEQVA